jgi:hypothetical protein
MPVLACLLTLISTLPVEAGLIVSAQAGTSEQPSLDPDHNPANYELQGDCNILSQAYSTMTVTKEHVVESSIDDIDAVDFHVFASASVSGEPIVGATASAAFEFIDNLSVEVIDPSLSTLIFGFLLTVDGKVTASGVAVGRFAMSYSAIDPEGGPGYGGFFVSSDPNENPNHNSARSQSLSGNVSSFFRHFMPRDGN